MKKILASALLSLSVVAAMAQGQSGGWVMTMPTTNFSHSQAPWGQDQCSYTAPTMFDVAPGYAKVEYGGYVTSPAYVDGGAPYQIFDRDGWLSASPVVRATYYAPALDLGGALVNIKRYRKVYSRSQLRNPGAYSGGFGVAWSNVSLSPSSMWSTYVEGSFNSALDDQDGEDTWVLEDNYNEWFDENLDVDNGYHQVDIPLNFPDIGFDTHAEATWVSDAEGWATGFAKGYYRFEITIL